MRDRERKHMISAVRKQIDRALSARLAYANEADPERERPLLETCDAGALINQYIEAKRVMHRAVVRAEVLEGMLLDAKEGERDAVDREYRRRHIAKGEAQAEDAGG